MALHWLRSHSAWLNFLGHSTGAGETIVTSDFEGP